MTPEPSDFASLIQRFQEGCPSAQEELFKRYGDAVRRVVRRKLRRAARRRLESVDVAQSVWKSFFLGDVKGYRFPTPEALVNFLVTVAMHKAVDALRRQFNQARDVRRERSLDDSPSADGSPLAQNLAATTHTPSQYGMATERWLMLTRNLPSQHVRILELLHAGYTQADVAQEVGCDPETIRRLRDRLRQTVFPS